MEFSIPAILLKELTGIPYWYSYCTNIQTSVNFLAVYVSQIHKASGFFPTDSKTKQQQQKTHLLPHVTLTRSLIQTRKPHRNKIIDINTQIRKYCMDYSCNITTYDFFLGFYLKSPRYFLVACYILLSTKVQMCTKKQMYSQDPSLHKW